MWRLLRLCKGEIEKANDEVRWTRTLVIKYQRKENANYGQLTEEKYTLNIFSKHVRETGNSYYDAY